MRQKGWFVDRRRLHRFAWASEMWPLAKNSIMGCSAILYLSKPDQNIVVGWSCQVQNDYTQYYDGCRLMHDFSSHRFVDLAIFAESKFFRFRGAPILILLTIIFGQNVTFSSRIQQYHCWNILETMHGRTIAIVLHVIIYISEVSAVAFIKGL